MTEEKQNDTKPIVRRNIDKIKKTPDKSAEVTKQSKPETSETKELKKQKDGITLTKEDAIAALSSVVDPEIQVDVWTLGLVYTIEIKEENRIYIKMTLTTPFCPYAPQLIQEVKDELSKSGFLEPQVEIVFEPQWEPSDELKMYLGLP